MNREVSSRISLRTILNIPIARLWSTKMWYESEVLTASSTEGWREPLDLSFRNITRIFAIV